MNTKRNYYWTRKLLLAVAGPIIWLGLSAGVFAIAINDVALGIFEIVSAVAILLLVMNKRVGEYINGRPVRLFSIGFGAVFFVVIGISKIGDLLTTKITLLGDIYVPNVILVVSAVGYLIVLLLLFIELAGLLRSRENTANSR